MLESRLAVVLVTLLACGCSSQRGADTKPLPFHVAVIPLEPRVDDTIQLTSIEFEALDDLQLSFDPEATTDALVAALDGQAFSTVTRLTFPEGMTAEGFREQLAREGASATEYWIDQASAQGADLVLLTDFAYSPTVWSEINGSFWLNLPLFLLGGPFCYFVDDRDYHTSVEMETKFFEVAPLKGLASQASFSGRTGSQYQLVDDIQNQLRRSDLDFIDRADWNAGYYGLSLILPAGLLAKQSDGVRKALEADIVNQVATDLTEDVRVRGDQIGRGQRRHNFWVDFGSLATVTAPEGNRLEGRVVLEIGGDGSSDEMAGFRYSLDGRPTTSDGFAGADRVERTTNPLDVYTFSIPLGAGTLPERIRFEIEDTGTGKRSYTIDPSLYVTG